MFLPHRLIAQSWESDVGWLMWLDVLCAVLHGRHRCGPPLPHLACLAPQTAHMGAPTPACLALQPSPVACSCHCSVCQPTCPTPQTAHVGALYPAFLAMQLTAGVPPIIAALSLGFMT